MAFRASGRMSMMPFSRVHPLLREPNRLALLGAIISAKSTPTFNELLEKLGLSKGNLSAHTKKMEEAGLITVEKHFVDRKPQTTCVATPAGREAINTYLDEMETFIASNRGGRE